MPKIIIPPTRLQPDTKWPEAIPQINNNFENIVDSLGGFSVENVLAFPDNASSLFVPSGGLGLNPTYTITTSTDDDVVFVVPQVSIYVDAPPLDDIAEGYDINYLWPTGSALTAEMLAFIPTVVTGISGEPTGASFVGSDGRTYQYANSLTVMIRNAGASSHTYYMVISQSVYTKSNSFYR